MEKSKAIQSNPNTGKKIEIKIEGEKYNRYPIKTHVVEERDNIKKIVIKYVLPLIREGDIIVIAERIVAIAQGRSYPIDSIKPSLIAKILCRFVTKNSGGIGLRSPWTMQLALDEVGVFRILFATCISAITKPLGIRGIFYKLAGGNINAIDGPCDYTLPPGNICAKLGPKNPDKVASEITKITNCQTVIIDANDLGINILGSSPGVDIRLIKEVFKDNPLGQSKEQTPIAIVRKS